MDLGVGKEEPVCVCYRNAECGVFMYYCQPSYSQSYRGFKNSMACWEEMQDNSMN